MQRRNSSVEWPQRRPGAIARVQRALTLALVASALGWLVFWWSLWPLAALVGFTWLALLHAWFLAIEFIAIGALNRDDPAPRASARARFVAWLVESGATPRVFYWRQPFFSEALPDFLPQQQPTGRRGVVLVHGFVCNRGFWNPWIRRLRAQGRAVAAPSFEPVTGSIDGYSATLDQAIEQVSAATGRPPLLVCHSMGGLIARAWLRNAGDGAAGRVARIVTIASPHHGTWMARFSLHENGRQMRQSSAWLAELRRAEPPRRDALFTCWYSNCDNIVAPASSATLPGADNRLVRGAPHVALAFEPEVMRETLALLDAD